MYHYVNYTTLFSSIVEPKFFSLARSLCFRLFGLLFQPFFVLFECVTAHIKWTDFRSLFGLSDSVNF